MIEKLILSFTFIQYVVFATCLHAFFGLSRKKEIHRYVLVILTFFSASEIISNYLDVCLITNKLNVNIATAVHSIMWLLIVKKSACFPSVVGGLTIAFTTFCLCNLFFIEGWQNFNIYSVILGAMLYLIIFLVESFYQLKKENFHFFFSNHFILLTSPILFFIGISVMIGFRSKALVSTIVFNNYNLYFTIITIANIVYYSLVNLYIYREKRKLNEF